MRVVGCFLEYNGTFVLLRRHAHKSEGGTWGLPAGKVEPGETDEVAMIRELYEETGYRAKPSELRLLGVYDFETPNGTTNNFATYRVLLEHPYEVILENAAHSEHRWVNPEEAYAMPDLIFGLHDLLKLTGMRKVALT